MFRPIESQSWPFITFDLAETASLATRISSTTCHRIISIAYSESATKLVHRRSFMLLGIMIAKIRLFKVAKILNVESGRLP